MNHALTLRPPAPLRIGLLLLLSFTLLLASALSLAPALARSASHSAGTHAELCKCAHCPGEQTCCCSLTATCPTR